MLKLGIDSQPDLQPSGLADVQERMFLKLGFATDSPLEGTGFEPSVPLAEWEARGGWRIDFEGGFCRALRFQTASVVSSAAISRSEIRSEADYSVAPPSIATSAPVT